MLSYRQHKGGLRVIPKMSFHIRALFDYDPENDDSTPAKGIKFNFGDVLHALNAADEEWWSAQFGNFSGLIPSKQRVENKLFSQQRAVSFKNDNGEQKFSFFKRNRKNRKSERSGNCINLFSYQKVTEFEVSYKRPILILGYLKDLINEELLSYSECDTYVPFTTRLPKPGEINGYDFNFITYQTMLQYVHAKFFLEAGSYNGDFYGISLESIKKISAQKFCIMDIGITSIIKLVDATLLHPLVIYIQPKSAEQISNTLNVHLNEANELLKECAEVEDRMDLIDALVEGDTINKVIFHVKAAIRRFTGAKIWLPSETFQKDRTR